MTMRRKLCCLAAWAALALPLYSASPLLVLVGPPGSGRSTQAALLSKELGIPVISVDDLIARNPGKFQKKLSSASTLADPRLDPALNDLVAEALRGMDLSKGVLLDGYPASKAQADFLQSVRAPLGLPAPIVIQLNAPDDVVRKRLKGQTRDIEQEIKDYHREFDFITTYFPQADIRAVDATKKPAEVTKDIRRSLEKAGK
jgi:adenylate kinase